MATSLSPKLYDMDGSGNAGARLLQSGSKIYSVNGLWVVDPTGTLNASQVAGLLAGSERQVTLSTVRTTGEITVTTP